jgi:hypothetical protein
MDSALRELAKKVAQPRTLAVGFLENATYRDGTPIAYIASVQEFGGRIEREPSETTIYRRVKADGEFARGGRFVKKSKSNFATTHYVGAHVINIPARPFFRQTIANGSKHWGTDLGRMLIGAQYNVPKSLARMGLQMIKELQAAIVAFSDPPNAPSTIAKKGFNKPLIDSGDMKASVDAEVT